MSFDLWDTLIVWGILLKLVTTIRVANSEEQKASFVWGLAPQQEFWVLYYAYKALHSFRHYISKFKNKK